MSDDIITDYPDGATPLEDLSGLLRSDITTRGPLNEAEALNIVSASDWIERGRIRDVFTVRFYRELHRLMYDEVWSWAGVLRSETGAVPNIGVEPTKVPAELGRVAMEFSRDWATRDEEDLLHFIARYHHALVWVHPFNNGNGRWARLACDAVVGRLHKGPGIIWASDLLNLESDERSAYIAALKQADLGKMQPLVEYLEVLNPGR